MESNLQNEIKQALDNFGIQLAKDLEISLNEALKKGSKHSRPQQAALQFNPVLRLDKTSYLLDIIASDGYWEIIEYGRNGKKKRWHNRPGAKANPKAPPSDIILDWIKKVGIKPEGVQSLKGAKNKSALKTSNQNKYKNLTFLIQRKIGNFGIKPKPFVNKVTKDGRLEKLEAKIATIIGKDIQLQLKQS